MDPELSNPQIGQWYVRQDDGAMFQVTGIDETAGSIEIQYFDGDLDEIEVPDWRQMPLELTEAPEDCSGAIDDVETEDFGYSETGLTPHERQTPALDSYRNAAEAARDTTDADDRD